MSTAKWLSAFACCMMLVASAAAQQLPREQKEKENVRRQTQAGAESQVDEEYLRFWTAFSATHLQIVAHEVVGMAEPGRRTRPGQEPEDRQPEQGADRPVREPGAQQRPRGSKAENPSVQRRAEIIQQLARTHQQILETEIAQAKQQGAKPGAARERETAKPGEKSRRNPARQKHAGGAQTQQLWQQMARLQQQLVELDVQAAIEAKSQSPGHSPAKDE